MASFRVNGISQGMCNLEGTEEESLVVFLDTSFTRSLRAIVHTLHMVLWYYSGPPCAKSKAR